jgi:putative addiction module component (TIGR02574 family)
MYGGNRMLIEKIKTSALGLKAIDRIHLAETLLESLNKTDEQIEKKWVLESEKRYKAYKNGQVEGIPLEQLRLSIEK